MVNGTALVTRDSDQVLLRENESIYIPLGAVHRRRGSFGPLKHLAAARCFRAWSSGVPANIGRLAETTAEQHPPLLEIMTRRWYRQRELTDFWNGVTSGSWMRRSSTCPTTS